MCVYVRLTCSMSFWKQKSEPVTATNKVWSIFSLALGKILSLRMGLLWKNCSWFAVLFVRPGSFLKKSLPCGLKWVLLGQLCRNRNSFLFFRKETELSTFFLPEKCDAVAPEAVKPAHTCLCVSLKTKYVCCCIMYSNTHDRSDMFWVFWACIFCCSLWQFGYF